MKVAPVPSNVPPVGESYQLIVPVEAVAPKVTVPLPQALPGVVDIIIGIGNTVAVTGDLAKVVHPLSVAST